MSLLLFLFTSISVSINDFHNYLLYKKQKVLQSGNKILELPFRSILASLGWRHICDFEEENALLRFFSMGK